MTVGLSSQSTCFSDRIWRVQDLARLASGYHYEIIHGVLYATRYPPWPHPLIIENFQRTLGCWIWQHELGHLFSARSGIYYSETQYVDPGLLFVRHNQTPKGKGRLRQATLVIDVVSESNTRAPRQEREALFHRTNVQEIWYADPESETVEVCERTESGYSVVHTFGKGDVLTSALFSGFSVPVSHIWRSRVTSD